MSLLEEAKKEIDSYSKGGPISYADLIQFAGNPILKRLKLIERNFLDDIIKFSISYSKNIMLKLNLTNFMYFMQHKVQ